MHNLLSSSEHVTPGSLHIVGLWPLILFLVLGFPNFSRAQSGTPATVTLTYVAAGPLTSSTTVSLLADVSKNGFPVTTGTVTFYEGQAVIGTKPVSAAGTVSLNIVFPPGNYTLLAHYNGSAQAGPGSSPQGNTLTIAGTDQLALGITGTQAPYSLTATLTTNLAQGATGGQITFTDTTSGQTLGTADMDQTTYRYQSPVDMTGPVGDFNGDGRADTVNGQYFNSDFSSTFAYIVNLSNPDGTMTQVVSEPFGQTSDPIPIIAVGDFNDDGMTDLLVQDTVTNVLTVLLSQGNGQFTIAGQMTIPYTAAAVVGDFNNDRNLDVIADNSSGLEFYAGDGAGHLAAGETVSTTIPGAALAADYNQDGNLDFFSNQPLNGLSFAGTSLYLGAGNGTTFTQQPQTIFGAYPPPANINSMVTADFNGDGIPDIAYADYSTVTVLLGDGRGGFYPSELPVIQIGTHATVRLAVANVNGDGYEDIVAFVQDEAGSQAMGAPIPWNMIVLTGIGNGIFNVSTEAASDSSGTRFPTPPVGFAFPTLGEPLSTQSPLLISEPFLADNSSTLISATLTGVTIPPGPPHTIVATYDGPRYSNGVLPTATSNSVQLSGTGGIYYTQGFTPGSIATNGTAVVTNDVLQLTDGGPNEAGSAFAPSAVNVQSFATTFYFQLVNAQADGITFTLQNAAPQALGGTGGALGYSGIPNSVALKFDLFNNAGEGNDSIGVFTNGALPTVPATDMTASGVNLHSGHLMQAQLIYDGKNLHVTVTDTANEQSFQQTFPIDIPGAIGSPTAYVGFTGATGGLTATQSITSWTYTPLPYYPNFSSGPALDLNGGALIRGTSLHLIDSGVADEARSAWFSYPVPVGQFTCDFTFFASNAIADGLTFTIQNAGPTALGPFGGGLGYGAEAPGGSGGIANSIAIKFDLYSNQGEGNDSTGLYSDGASPTVPAINLSSTGINLHSNDPINAHMVYDGTTLTVTLLDTVTKATATQTYTVSIPATVGGPVAYVGFTAGTGSLSASEDIAGWTYLPSSSITSPVSTY